MLLKNPKAAREYIETLITAFFIFSPYNFSSVLLLVVVRGRERKSNSLQYWNKIMKTLFECFEVWHFAFASKLEMCAFYNLCYCCIKLNCTQPMYCVLHIHPIHTVILTDPNFKYISSVYLERTANHDSLTYVKYNIYNIYF